MICPRCGNEDTDSKTTYYRTETEPAEGECWCNTCGNKGHWQEGYGTDWDYEEFDKEFNG